MVWLRFTIIVPSVLHLIISLWDMIEVLKRDLYFDKISKFFKWKFLQLASCDGFSRLCGLHIEVTVLKNLVLWMFSVV